MNAKWLCVAATVTAGMLVVGSVQAATGGCDRKTCTVIVNVSDSNAVSADPDELVPTVGKGKEIVWQINQALKEKWRFVNNSVVFSNDSPDKSCSEKQFTNGTISDDGHKFTMKNKNKCVRNFKYTVKVTDGTNNFTSPDPTIVNQGENFRASARGKGSGK